jgi:hypothetical protein
MRSLYIIAFFSLIFTWSCASDCAEQGCLNTTTFAFIGLGGVAVEGVTGTVTMGATVTQFDCGPMGGGDGSEYRCIENAVVIYSRETPNASLSVTSSNGSLGFDGQINLEFTSIFPNGEGCPGECRSSTDNSVQLVPSGG